MTFLSDRAITRLRDAAAWPELDSRYTVTGVAGHGGSATVYVARDHVLDRDVAVKVIHLADRSGRGAARLSDEALILARLDHPGIVPVHDRGVLSDGRAFYVMKLVNGQRLTEATAAQRSLADRLATFARVLEAVAFAHAHGIVHRDLKPENILVGAYGEVYVMDWGVATGEAGEAEPAVVGTPGFMPPEQERAAAVDPRADVFALGAVLGDVVGASPPRALAAIARKAGERHPDARYPSVKAMADDLARFRDGQAVSAHRESIAERLLRVYRRYELPIVLMLAYVLMRAALLLWRGI